MVSALDRDITESLVLRETDPQLRRQTRERREYIFKKSLESQERAIYERKQKIKDLLAQGKEIPNELKAEARTLGKDLPLDEAQQGGFSSTSACGMSTEGSSEITYRRRVCQSRDVRPQDSHHHLSLTLISPSTILQSTSPPNCPAHSVSLILRNSASSSPIRSDSTEEPPPPNPSSRHASRKM